MSLWRKKTCSCRIPDDEASALLFEHSGYLGDRIVALYRFMHDAGQFSGSNNPWRWKLRRWLDRYGISRVIDFLYTYGIGGSLTRQDQLTFARFHAMEGRAYRLTLVNSLAFGIPSALLYFAVGEGFEILSRASSMAEFPSLVAAHASFAMGVINAAVHLFRIFDSLAHRRCWAPLGTIPLVINLPTYLKAARRRISDRRPQPTDCDCP
jgi:hypothetical protein